MRDRETAWAEAMRAARRGDARGYEAFLQDLAIRLRRITRRHMLRLGLSAANIEDVVQEILLAVHNKRHHWDEQRPLIPWLNAIARYKMIDATRRMRRDARHRIHLADDEWEAIFAEQPLPEERRGREVERLLSSLPRGQQTVTRALGLEGQSPRDVARRLGMSESAVRVAFHRALKRLMLLAEEGSN